MTFDKHELKLLAAAGHLALAPGAPVHKSALSFLFARPGFLQKQIDKLRLHGFITFDPFKSEVRVLARPVLEVLNEFAAAGELFQNERPMDAVLAESLRADLTTGQNLPECEKTPERVFLHAAENGGGTAKCLAPVEKPKPPDPPPPIGNPSRVCGDLRSFAGETFAGTLPKNLRNFADGQTPELQDSRVLSRSLKEKLKSCKALQEIGSLKEALRQIELGHEYDAVDAMRSILGGICFEGGDKDNRTGEIREGDGGKWRKRWLTNRRKVHAVFAELVAEIAEKGDPEKGRGAAAEIIWGILFGKYAQGFKQFCSENMRRDSSS